jgi:hypothetical protein
MVRWLLTDRYYLANCDLSIRRLISKSRSLARLGRTSSNDIHPNGEMACDLLYKN